MSAKDLSYNDIAKYFACPLYEACIYLKIEKHLLKERLTELGIKKWPYRKYQKKDLKKPEGMFVTFEVDLNTSPKLPPLSPKISTPDSSPKFEPLRKNFTHSPDSSPQNVLLSKGFERISVNSPKQGYMDKSPRLSPKNMILEKNPFQQPYQNKPSTWINLPDISSMDEDKKPVSRPGDRISINNLVTYDDKW